MQPAGTSLVNTAYFASLTARINAIEVCADLQAAVNEVMADLQAAVTGVEHEIAALLPMITLPTDLGSVISYITNLAQPYIKAYENTLAQLTALTAAIAQVAAAMEAAAARIESCALTVPPIV